MSDKQNVFSSLSPKATFILGIVVTLLAVFAVGFFVLLGQFMDNGQASKTNQPANTNSNPTALAPAAPTAQGGRVNVTVASSDHIRGDKNAPVKIMEFSDYQCPYCSKFHPTMQQVMAEYGDQVAWVYKHFPLDSLHAQARPAAEASECVAEQAGEEGFWQFTDAMFANQESLSPTFYEQIAEEIGVNMSQFKDCVSSGKFQNRVEADYQQGISYGVNGTPGNFVNGVPVKGALPFSTIAQIIDSELN
ncbi:MAG TPA: thioredoxin domain-containing protein [Patescibacteria group bacterium]|nr:thioredoxin domain-containing protein [Patescibacteria group bacterium]